MIYKYISCFVFFLSIVISQSFSQIGVGEWRDHLSYNKAINLVKAGNKVYCTTTSGLFVYNKSDNSIEKLSKINGLSDININTIGYSDQHDVIIIGYINGNIDLISENRIINVPHIRQKIMTASKAINNIFIDGDYAYLSCGFGVVVFNLLKKEIKDTYKIIFNDDILEALDIVIYDGHIYVATESGVFKGSLDNNLVDFQNWHQIDDFPNANYKVNQIELFNDNVYLARQINDTTSEILYFTGLWNNLHGISSGKVNSLDVIDGDLVVSTTKELIFINAENNIINTIDDFKLYRSPLPNKIYKDSDGVIWIADYGLGLVSYNGGEFRNYYPNGPEDNNSWKMDFRDGCLWTSVGGIQDDLQNLWRNSRFHYFKEEKWRSFTFYTSQDVISIAIDPADPNHLFAGTFGHGLLEIKENNLVNEFNVNNQADHTLQTIIPGQNYIRIGGMAYDRFRNLWIANMRVKNLLSVLTKDGKWHGIPLGSLVGDSYYSGELTITRNNHKWMVLMKGGGLIVYDDNNTIDDLDDDSYKKFSVFDENKKVITSEVFTVEEDHEGDIWVGTDQGVYVYYNPENVFTGTNFYASDILIPRNDGTNLADRLLETEAVTCIEVDGANRKWFGTKNAGAFLFSEDGLTQIFNFNTKNSPILSDYIYDIEINGETGETFFSTPDGIISYKSTASDEGLQKKLTYVYPNPVRENYNGPITITGLFKDANVKITDISGNIVYETSTLGGQAIWNGKTFDGQRVKTGVYLIFCTTDDGTQTKMTKLLVIN